MTTDHPPATATPTPTTGEFLTAIVELCETYAKAEITRALAEHAGTKAERDDLIAHAAYWNRESRTRYDALITAVEAVLPRTAQVEEFLPVRTLPDGRVEIHALDQHQRPVVLALTGAEAVTVGVHLTAYAAIGLDRTGTKLDRILPPLPTTAPTATTAPPLRPSVPVINGTQTPAA